MRMTNGIYSLREISVMYRDDRYLYEARRVLHDCGYRLISEEVDVAGSHIRQAEENPRVASFLGKILDNLEYYGHLVVDKIDNYLLGRLMDVAKSFSVDRVIEFLKSARCYV